MSPPTFRAVAALSLAAGLVAGLAGCAGGPRSVERDGPEARPPANLERVPDAEPRLEPIRSGGPNKPYEVFGQTYVPITRDAPFAERGLASWYGRKFHGRPTSSGEPYDMYAMSAAHPTLPIPSYARVRNPANGREVIVRVNDRGPFHKGRVIDLSYTAALKLDLLRGVAPVELQRITFDEIRTGSWRREPVDTALAQAAAQRPAPAAAAPEPAVVALVPPEPVALRPADAAPAEPPVAEPAAPVPIASAARGWWIQLGAFRQRDGAEGFQRRIADELDWLAPRLALFAEGALYRLQAGPWPDREAARGASERIRETLQLVPVVVERR